MGYGIKIYQAARLEMEQRRRQAEAAAQERKDAFFLECPRAREIREEMAQNAAGAGKAVLAGGDVRQELSKLRDRGVSLKKNTRIFWKHIILQNPILRPSINALIAGILGLWTVGCAAV